MVYLRNQSGEMRSPCFSGGKNEAHPQPSGGFDDDLLQWSERNDSTRPPRGTRPKEQGFLTLGGCLLLLVAIAGVGLFQIMDLIHHQTRDQIRADQCTGYQVLRLRAARLALDQSYFRLDQERAAALLACVSPPTCEIAEESYRALAHFEKAKQLLIKATWDADAIRWSIGGGHESCKLIHGFRSPYPPFRYPIVNPELSVFDLQASTFTQNKNESLRLSIYLTQERSSAEASKGVDHDWTVRWIE